MDTSACTSTSQFVGQSSVPPTSVTHLLVVPSNELLINAALVHEMKPDNIARGVWKIEKKEKDAIFEARQIVGQKLHKIVIRPRDGINRGCNGKNAWEEAVRILIPWILNINVVEWERHDPDSLEKLQAALDNFF